MSRADWLAGLKTTLREVRTDPSARRRSPARRPLFAAEVLEDRTLLTIFASNDSYSLGHDTTLNQSAPGVLANDMVMSGGPASAVLDSGPSHASSFTLNADGSFSYTPTALWAGGDSFTYHATNSAGNSGIATVSLTVTNNVPSGFSDSYTVWFDEFDTVAESAAGVVANDSDFNGDPLTAVLKTGPAHGSLTLDPDGSFVYSRTQPGWTGTDSFTYAATDGIAESSPVTVTLTVTHPLEPRSDLDDQPIAGGSDLGGFSAAPLTGGLQVGRDAGPGATLVYDGLGLSDPIITAETRINGIPPLPDTVEVRLSMGGVTKDPVWYGGGGLGSGFPIRLALQIDASTLATGRHAWEMEVICHYSGGRTATKIYTGYHDVVNRGDGVFGPGWTLDGLDQVVAGTGGALYVTARGQAFWFTDTGGGSYSSPAGPLVESTLFRNANGTYRLTDKRGDTIDFSSTGLITARIDRNGNATGYSYIDGDSDSVVDDLYQITDPFGRAVTFAYAGGRVSTVTDFASRTTALGRDGAGRLTTVTLPDPDGAGSQAAPVWEYAYTAGLLSSVTDPLDRATDFEYDFAERLARAVRPDANDETFTAVQTQGLVDTGSGDGTPTNLATLYVVGGAVATFENPMQQQATFETDRFGYTTSYEDPLGRVTLTERDANGRVTQVTQPATAAGTAVTEYFYDANGNLNRILFPGGAEQTWVYDQTKNVPTSFTDELDDDWTSTYDAAGNLLTATDPLGKVTTYTYNSRGQVLTVTRPDPDGAGAQTAPVTTYEYDTTGRLKKVIHPDTNYVTLTYDTADNLLTQTNELGHVTTYAYDALGRLTSVTAPDPDGVGSLTSPVTSYAYDAYGNVTSATDPLGKVTTYEYDDRNRLWKTTLPDPDGAGSLTSPVYTSAFDAAGRLTGETDPLGKTTNHQYDSAGRRTKTTLADPDGAGPLGRPETLYEYDAVGRLTKVSAPDPDGSGPLARSATTYAYDLRGRLTNVTDPVGAVTAYEYDDAGRLVETTFADPDGAGPLGSPVSTATYDPLGRTLTSTDPLGKVTTYAYDALGRLTSVTRPDPDGAGSLTSPVTTYAYDSRDRVTSVVDPLGHTTSYAYDAAGRRTGVTAPDPDGAGPLSASVTTYAYDNLGRTTSVTDADSGVTSFAYDAAGRMTSLTDPVGNETTWSYDALGRVTAETNELAEARTFVYDAAGRLTKRTDRNGLAVGFAYDGIGRLLTEQWLAADGVTVVNTVSYAYDAASRLTTISDAGSVYAYAYDAAGRVTEVDNDGTPGAPNLDVVLTQTYDTLGRRTSVTSTVNGTADLENDYAYDAVGQTTRVEQSGQTGGNAVAEKRVDLAYDALGRSTSLTRYEDLAATLLVATSTYVFDAAGRLTALDHKKGANNLANYAWTYDAAGRLTQTTSGDGTTTYGYDVTNQLTAADHSYQTDESYGYDANGNRTNTGYSTTANNRLASDGTYDYTYDDEGNRTRKTTIATGAYVDYGWDHRNRLASVTSKTAAGVMTKQVTYRYDVHDRRIAKDVDDNGDGTVDRGEWYVYDGDRILFRTDRGGAITNRYLHGPQIDQLFSDESTVDGLLWALADHQGTVRDWADFASGTNTTTVANHLKYDAFGSITSQSSGTHEPLFAYTGREWDADAELYYYRARWYDPAVGRFVSEDRVGFAAGDANLGRYVGNSPTNFIDPSGLTEVPVWPTYVPPGWTYEQYWASMYSALLLVPPTDGIVQGFDWLDRNFGGDFYGGPDASGQIIAGIGTLASFAPIAGEIGDAGQLLLGRDFNGNALTATDQALMAGGLALPLVPGSLLAKTDDVVRAVPPLGCHGGCGTDLVCFPAGTGVVIDVLPSGDPVIDEPIPEADGDANLYAAALASAVVVLGARKRSKRRTRGGERAMRGSRRSTTPIRIPHGTAEPGDDELWFFAADDETARVLSGPAAATLPEAMSRPVAKSGWLASGLRRGVAVVGSIAVAVCLLLAGLDNLKPVPEPPAVPVALGEAVIQPIEQVRLGQRVHADLPAAIAAAAREATGPLPPWDGRPINPFEWRKVEFRLPKAEGGHIAIALLRPAGWVEEIGAVPGGTVPFSLPEQGLAGDAEVVSIGRCPPIDEGDGAVVTGTFAHVRGGLLSLDVAGLDEPLVATGNHPFWSETRGSFLRADELEEGETLRTLAGPARLDAIRLLPGEVPVYNLEVAGVHAYRVGAGGVLVHNNCVRPYEVGMAGDLRARSVVGDALQIHHVGQQHPMRQMIAGYDPDTAPAIMLPDIEHRRLTNFSGPFAGTPRDLLATQIRDLRRNTNAPNASLQDLIEANRTMYPGSF